LAVFHSTDHKSKVIMDLFHFIFIPNLTKRVPTRRNARPDRPSPARCVQRGQNVRLGLDMAKHR
jgi:hypothetical protein